MMCAHNVLKVRAEFGKKRFAEKTGAATRVQTPLEGRTPSAIGGKISRF